MKTRPWLSRCARRAGSLRISDALGGRLWLTLLCVGVLSACADDGGGPDEPERVQAPEGEIVEGECTVTDGENTPFVQMLGCSADFDVLSSEPISSSIPGARSVKTVYDRTPMEQYFQNSILYPIHWEFASNHLSIQNGMAPVPALGIFNASEYFSPTRRFILGAATYYEGPAIWAWELSPYDTADAEMIATAYRSVRDNAFFGPALYFHPTSAALEQIAEGLPEDVRVVSTDELFAGVDYQPLNLARSVGLLRYISEEEAELVDFREIVVLEAVPNDIGVVQGIITQQFQTPLSHINVLSQNRGTPNMGLRGAWTNSELRALDGKWVELSVGSNDWTVREVTEAEAETWWLENRPDAIDVGPMDTSIQVLTNAEDIIDLDTMTLQEALQAGVPAFGGKGTHFGALALIPEVPNPPGFVVPVYFFNQYMEENNLWVEVDAILASEETRADVVLRRDALARLRGLIEEGTVNADFLSTLETKLALDFPDTRMRFRSSTNAEDVSNFNGAGLYTSRSGDPNDPNKSFSRAVREVWASVYSDRAFSEREYYGIEHRNIGMALLVHRSFPNEDANGVAITSNVFDPDQLDAPSFYVNVQEGGLSVVIPEQGTSTDQFLNYYQSPNQPIVYLASSNQIADGETVLTAAEVNQLANALDAIHVFFRPVYGSSGGFYGMDCEFKFDSSATGVSRLYVKQARPYPGWGSNP
ncbi:MAG: hypothetical protein ACI81R_002968 [Bradymonadia bacterium]|jgi:hypothetical protein